MLNPPPDDGHPEESPPSAPTELRGARRYERIYALVRRIPRGRVATYGQIAALEGHSTPRQVGYALAALTLADVPWHRVVNRHGTVSPRTAGDGEAAQRDLLGAEGVDFDLGGRIALERFGWSGPDWDWLEANRFFPAPAPGRPYPPRR